eukprot:9954478-Lingulodinium_polyedra.AAC.1
MPAGGHAPAAEQARPPADNEGVAAGEPGGPDMRALRRPWWLPVGSVRLPAGDNVPAAAICALVADWAVGY